MKNIGGVSELLLGVVIGCLGSAVLYGIVLPRMRLWWGLAGSARDKRMRPDDGTALRSGVTYWGIQRRTVKRIFSTPELIVGCAIVLVFAVVAIAAPVFAPPEGEEPYFIPAGSFAKVPEPPSPEHPLGTMQRQYDILYGLVWGTRVAFKVGLSITVGRALIGVLLGLISGYSGGLLAAVVMRITDAFLAFPIMAAALVMLTFFGGGLVGVVTGGADRVVILSLILFGWMQYARIVRGNALVEREKEYVQAAICVGARSRRIIFRHVLPNATRGLFVVGASDIGAMVVLAAVFSFMGLSGGEALADWGQMLNFSRNWIIGTPANAFKYWYTYFPPSMSIVVFSMGWNLIGDGLRDVLDPRLR